MDLRVFTEPQQGATYDDLLALARTAEELGYGAFFRSDHYLAMNADGRPGPTDAWITLASLARETSRIRLGTLVTSATFRYPGPLGHGELLGVGGALLGLDEDTKVHGTSLPAVPPTRRQPPGPAARWSRS